MDLRPGLRAKLGLQPNRSFRVRPRIRAARHQAPPRHRGGDRQRARILRFHHLRLLLGGDRPDLLPVRPGRLHQHRIRQPDGLARHLRRRLPAAPRRRRGDRLLRRPGGAPPRHDAQLHVDGRRDPGARLHPLLPPDRRRGADPRGARAHAPGFCARRRGRADHRLSRRSGAAEPPRPLRLVAERQPEHLQRGRRRRRRDPGPGP